MAPARAEKQEVLSIEITGGPESPGSHRKWMADGAVALRDLLTERLAELGYKGSFMLVGKQGMNGGKQQFVRYSRVVPERNCIDLTAQLTGRLSRWKYELCPPSSVDVVTLFAQLKAGEHVSDDSDDVDEDGLPVEEAGAELPQDAAGHEDGGKATLTLVVDSGAPVVTSVSPEAAAEVVIQPVRSVQVAGPSSVFSTELVALEVLEAEFAAAAQSIKDNEPEIDKLKREISERQQLLEMYAEEQKQAEAILSSDVHREAAKKIKMIREIILGR